MQRLPKILAHEPLVDAVFEIRLGGGPQLADILPGILFGELEPKPTIVRLPAAEIPRPIRVEDPNLIYAPVTRLDWDRFTISFGDQNLVIGCKMPYARWPRFKEVILDIVGRISRVGILGEVERYSLKYVNLIQAPTILEQIAKVNMTVKVGEVEATEDHVSVQVHSKEQDILHILSIVTGARGNLSDGNEVFGAVVDIDSIRMLKYADLTAFNADLDSAIETLRQANKTKFFSCLKETTIEEMGPQYD